MRYIGAVKLLTNKRTQSMKQQDMEMLIQHWPGFLSVRDSSHRFTYINRNFKNWLDLYCVKSPIGFTGPEVAVDAPDNVATMLLACHDASLEFIETGISLTKVIEFRGLEGTQHFNVIKFKSVIDGHDQIFTTGFDVTKLHETAQFYQLLSQTDPLTGLNNKEAVKRYQSNAGIAIVIDLNNFKNVNDTDGHLEGDEVLKGFASLMVVGRRLSMLQIKKCTLTKGGLSTILRQLRYRPVIIERAL